ncbi:NAD kinase [Cecembia lonarensis]|uniref:NAD kinase n=1 Tax=Cecembia lonarensis (strain CCUG 58316 / KCTC 22772 / LW9) TaxID=1225176 RepID=K1LJU5_CECL9|nr:NAD kinase [Cecembia lonarensis]EKB50593.1 putative inorganic polyphosphate/ATP-NAD kinase [Cecembia lonarensis LW9]
MNIVLHGINLEKEFVPYFEQLIKILESRGIRTFFTENFAKSIKKINMLPESFEVLNPERGMSDVDFVLSIGGDGTLLDTVIQVGAQETPIIGINSGRLGFLATVAKENIQKAIDDLVAGEFTIESRALVSLEASRPVFSGMNFGLNEFTIHKRDTSSMIIVHTYINGQYLNSYWADGLIVATPTGSTGYSLSCGGPLITPGARNFVITPVSPHNLNVRPIVVPDESVISFKIEGRSEKFLISLDSRSTAIDATVELKLKKADFSAKLVKFSGYNYFDTLRQKLNWGFDMRN